MLCHLSAIQLLKRSQCGQKHSGQLKQVLSYSDVCQTREKTETFGQEWFDDDFGLSRTRREAEELRLQQLQIEQEIQQLQAQQEHIPYFYLREIPNKPPPPYTPPGKPLSEIPNTEADLVNVTTTAVRILTDEMARGKSLEEIEPTNEFYEKVTTDHMRCYKKFLFDLTRHILEDVFSRQKTKTGVLPWTKTRTRLSVYKYCQIERTFEALSEHVKNRVSVLFGFTKKVGRESLTMRCFKKKRDHVDEILVAEAQEEESEWTEFDEDQVSVKNEVALAILDGLLLESAQLVKVIANKRMKKE
ncbi:hypothetical protein RUM44_009898 [Polyplax serrata]|uniref:DUF4378 domain-containing protein n=1 Tax=Polyplax serrata TaxID=468196 RepID=A0ABR1AU13_POLSC